MGMFSWKCKGCGHELIQGEDVRLDGTRQEYDGYGGTAARIENYDPSAWHNRCYLKDCVVDDARSESAPNQGFGPKKLEFLEGYDEAKPTTYSVAIFTSYYVGGKSGRFEFYYTNNNKLEEYRKCYDKYTENYVIPEMEDWDSWLLLGEEKQNEICNAHDIKRWEAIGKCPQTNTKEFSSIDEAIATIDALLPGCLPEIVGGAYSLVVYGNQGSNVEGAVYERSVEGLEVTEKYRIGDAAKSNVKDKIALAVKLFLEVEKEYEQASAALGRAIEPVMNGTQDVEELHELADQMPKKWRGVRRIYEQILHLEGDKE